MAKASETVTTPEGWKLIPKSPTDEMLTRGLYAQHGEVQNLNIGELKRIYAAMIDAAPIHYSQVRGVLKDV